MRVNAAGEGAPSIASDATTIIPLLFGKPEISRTR